jgi:small GTP-binding protein domain
VRAHSALRDVNLVLFVIDADKWTQNDDLVLEKLKNADMPVILVINKIDTLENKNHALPLIQERAKLMNFAEIVPVSALRGANLDHLRSTIEKYLPFQPPLYSLEQLTIVQSVSLPLKLSVKKSCVNWVKSFLMI